MLALAWVAGFAWFVARVDRPAPPLSPCEGIAVLTGGAGRTEAGLMLLREGYAAHMLVSGVGTGIGLDDVLRHSGTEATDLASRVTLGREATTTRGNAREIAAWAGRNELRCVIVVTSAYHMPRALLEISRILPGVRLESWPVAAATRSWRVLAEEYAKFVTAAAGLSWLVPTRLPDRGGRAVDAQTAAAAPPARFVMP